VIGDHRLWRKFAYGLKIWTARDRNEVENVAFLPSFLPHENRLWWGVLTRGLSWPVTGVLYQYLSPSTWGHVFFFQWFSCFVANHDVSDISLSKSFRVKPVLLGPISGPICSKDILAAFVMSTYTCFLPFSRDFLSLSLDELKYWYSNPTKGLLWAAVRLERMLLSARCKGQNTLLVRL
jgi:hypothetical protein